MTNYTSCFLGIPLPQEYINEFGKLLIDVHSIDPLIETVQAKTPHITIYYLDKQSQYSLPEISRLVQPFTNILRETILKVETFGYFTEEKPKVLFLDIKYPESLINFRNKTSEILKGYNALDNTLPFHPHMTVGRLKNLQAQKSFKINEKKLLARLSSISWDFKVNEIALCGVDSTKSPEYQEKLITIPIIY